MNVQARTDVAGGVMGANALTPPPPHPPPPPPPPRAEKVRLERAIDEKRTPKMNLFF